MAHYCTKDGDMLDAICHLHYGDSRGTVEAVLEANPGLASVGTVLPSGVVIELPELPELRQYTRIIHLWD